MNTARIHRSLEREYSSVAYAIDVTLGRPLPLSEVHRVVLDGHLRHKARLIRAICYLQQRSER